ncbi:unnamed protein product [Leptosia nina]|uniref:Uncharacterized protein n=1 Tax=Leptosia nina TaxID=320188 RepID=A0AAV1JYU3_9NEOP
MRACTTQATATRARVALTNGSDGARGAGGQCAEAGRAASEWPPRAASRHARAPLGLRPRVPASIAKRPRNHPDPNLLQLTTTS